MFGQGDAGWVFFRIPDLYPVRKDVLGSGAGCVVLPVWRIYTELQGVLGSEAGVPKRRRGFSGPQPRPSVIQVTADHVGYCAFRQPQLLRNG